MSVPAEVLELLSVQHKRWAPSQRTAEDLGVSLPAPSSGKLPFMSSTRRTARVASMIREVVSSAILFELRDPRIKNVTVLGADVSPDLRHASVRISVMGDEKTAALTRHGLTSAKGFLQSKVAEYIKSRYTPELRFIIDDGIKRSVETAALLRELIPAESDDLDSNEDEKTEMVHPGFDLNDDDDSEDAMDSADADHK